MRTVAPALLASCLLLGVPQRAAATDKFKIEIVETTMTVGLMPHTDPGSPEHIRTNCNTRAHNNTASTNCDSTVIRSTGPSSSLLPDILSFEAKAIFPDGSHVKLMCFPSRSNKKCKGITPIAPKTPDTCLFDAIAAFAANTDAVAGATKSCTVENLGFYQAKWEYDKNTAAIVLVIYGPRGILKYQARDSW